MPYSTVFPDGTQLESSAFTPQDLLVILQTLTYGMLGINPPAYETGRVRIDWQTTGQPAFTVNDDVCSLRATEENLEYSKQKDFVASPNPDSASTALGTYTFQRTWRCFFSMYGPNCANDARVISSALFLAWTHDILAQSGLYVVPDFNRPTYLKEQKNGEWWPRCDLQVLMNEQVTETITTSTIGSAEVRLEMVGTPNPNYPAGLGQPTQIVAEINVDN